MNPQSLEFEFDSKALLNDFSMLNDEGAVFGHLIKEACSEEDEDGFSFESYSDHHPCEERKSE